MKKLGSQIIDFKRMIRQYEFFVEDLNDLKELQSEVNSEFSSAIAGLKRPDLFDNKKIEKIAEEAEKKEERSEEPERDPLFKKLFRKMVVKCHPDRLPEGISDSKRSELKLQYENAIKANDDYNWALLISTAIKLEVELSEEYYEHVESLKEESTKVQKEIEMIQTSVAWTWYHASEDQKDQILQSYVKHMEKVIHGKPKVKFLGLGHPRTGTGYTAKLMSSWGLDIGHEKLGKDGIVAWQLVIDQGPWPWVKGFDEPIDHEFIIYNVRDPKTSIPSIVYTENITKVSLDFRIKRGRVKTSNNPVEQAILSILRWDQLICAKNPDFVYRIEDQSKDLFDFVSSKVEGLTFKEQDKYNARPHEDLDSLAKDIKETRADLKAALNEFCDKYGYERVF